MELKDLTGAKVLDAVDFCSESVEVFGTMEHCQVCRFRLDGVVYVAVENPDDGYRSSMQDLVIDNNAEMKNVFVACEVICKHKTEGSYGLDDILELVDAKTGKTVLQVGTTDIDDYYPGFVANFDPTAMAANA